MFGFNQSVSVLQMQNEQMQQMEQMSRAMSVARQNEELLRQQAELAAVSARQAERAAAIAMQNSLMNM